MWLSVVVLVASGVSYVSMRVVAGNTINGEIMRLKIQAGMPMSAISPADTMLRRSLLGANRAAGIMAF